MKNKILMAFTLLPICVSAQTQLRDYYDASSVNRAEFSYTIAVNIQKNPAATADANRYTATLIQALPDPKGYYHANRDNKFYTCSQLGNVCNPNNFNRISVTIQYTCNGQQKAVTIGFKNLNEQQLVPVVLGAGGKFCESVDFTAIKVIGAVLNPTHTGQIIDKINQLTTPKTTQNTSDQSNNPTTQQETTSTGISKNTSGNDPLAHFETDGNTKSNPMLNNSNSSSEEADALKGQQIADAATPLAESLVNAYNKRVDAKNAEFLQERKVREENEIQIKRNRFQTVYLPLMEEAIKGNQDTRMILYYASYQLHSTEFVPQRQAWYIEALEKNNLDAIMNAVENIILSGKDGMPALQKAANLGSVDAMIRLAGAYDLSPTYFAGSNAALALAWFTKAAEKGSPNAMYYLGMIYKYGIIEDVTTGTIKSFRRKMHVTYNIPPDYNKAVEWFSKSLIPDYKGSICIKGLRKYCRPMDGGGSYFISDSYLQLARMYKEGKGVAKDKVKASELENSYKNYRNIYPTEF